MGKKEELNKMYQEVYERIREMMPDKDIFPEMSMEDINEFVSQADWMGIPSFGITLKQMKEGHPHIDISHLKQLEKDMFLLIVFNATKGVDDFCNILHPLSKKQKEDLINELMKLSGNYKIEGRICPKANYGATKRWVIEFTYDCNNITEDNVKKILEDIKNLKIKRSKCQDNLGPGWVSVASIVIARIKVDRNDNEKIKEILSRISKIYKVILEIPKKSMINKMEREQLEKINNQIKEKKEKRAILISKRQFKMHHDKNDEEEIKRLEEEIKKLKEEIKEIEKIKKGY